MFVYVSVIWACVGAIRGQKRVLDPVLAGDAGVASHPVWVHETELRYCGRAVRALHHRAISAAP